MHAPEVFLLYVIIVQKPLQIFSAIEFVLIRIFEHEITKLNLPKKVNALARTFFKDVGSTIVRD